MRKLYSLVVFGLLSTIANAQIVNIPDSGFKAALLHYAPAIDTNNNNEIELSEALLVTHLTLPSFGQTDAMIGIEAFTNLVYLDCSLTNVGTLNVSSLVNLQYLDCSTYGMTLTGIEALSGLQHLDCSSCTVPGIATISLLTQLQYLDCSSQNIPILDVSNMTNLTYLDCSRSLIGQLNVSGSGITTLYCDINNLTNLNLSSLTNLTDLDCSSNAGLITTPSLGNLTSLQHLTCRLIDLNTLDLTSLTNLVTLDCMQNNLSSLNFANLPNLTELNCASNNFTSLTLTPLTNLRKLVCNSNHLSAININSLVNLTDLGCGQNQLTSLTINQLTNLETLDFANNQINVINLSPFTHLKELRCSSNQLSLLDISNNPLLVTLDCGTNLLNTLETSHNTLMRSVDCRNNLLTSLDFSSFSGIGGFAQYWFMDNTHLEYVNLKCGHGVTVNVNADFNCPNLTYICADEASVTSIINSLHFWGSNNNHIQVNSYCTFNPGGVYNTLTGTITLDTNANGCDTNDLHFPGIRVNVSNSTANSAGFTNNQGKFTFYVASGNFTLTPQPQLPYFTINPSSTVVNFPSNALGGNQTQDFCLTANGVHSDLDITIIPVTSAATGFDARYRVVFHNKGNQIASGTINFLYNDAILDLVSSNPSANNQSVGSLSWNFSGLSPFETRAIDLIVNVNSPLETPPVAIGDHLYFTASINPLAVDETLSDNTAVLDQIAVGSFDPNDKTCLEGNNMLPEQVGKYLNYVIRFQNSGTATAQNIVIKDVIDTSKFDISSLQLTESSHPLTTRISGNKVEFIFEGISLPAEINDEPGSHGFVAFKIKTKNNLVIGSMVANKADIYFDYNFPIATNTATTTVALLANDTFENKSVSVFPNPVKGRLTITAKENITSVQLYDVQGRLISTAVENSTAVIFDLEKNTAGVYFVKVYTANGVKVEKVIKQ